MKSQRKDYVYNTLEKINILRMLNFNLKQISEIIDVKYSMLVYLTKKYNLKQNKIEGLKKTKSFNRAVIDEINYLVNNGFSLLDIAILYNIKITDYFSYFYSEK